VLDLGCGHGCVGRFKPSADIKVYGLDMDREVVQQASQYEIAQVYDLESGHLPYEDEYFDGIIAKDVLEHLLRPWLVVAEMKRVLRPGKTSIASVPIARPRAVWADYTHIRGYTRHSLRMMFEDAGFNVVQVVKMGGIPGMGRWGMVSLIPYLLRFPPFDWLFTSSLEIVAKKYG